MRALRLESWLNGAAGAILLVGCLGSLLAVTRAFPAPLVEHVRKHDVGIVCTTGASQALEPLCEVQQIMPCSCVSLVALDRPELPLALSRPEPTSRTGWLNYMETIRLEARPGASGDHPFGGAPLMRLESWLNALAGFLVLVGCCAGLSTAMSALHPVLGSSARQSHVVMVCTSVALTAQVAHCVEDLDRGAPMCRCLPDPEPQVVGPPKLHLRQPEPPSRTALLNHSERIKLEARPPRPHIEI